MSLSLSCLLVRSIGIVNIIALSYCDLLWLKEELTEAVNIAHFVSEICVCACVLGGRGSNFDLGNYYPRDPWDVAHLLLFLKLCHFLPVSGLFSCMFCFPSYSLYQFYFVI